MSHSGLLLSALAHIGLLVLAAVGLPALHDPPDPFEMAVPVTVTMVSERTEAKAPLPPAEPLPPEAPPEPTEPEPVAAEPPPVETPPIETPAADPPKPEEPVEVAALTPEPPKPEPLPPEPEPAAAPLPPSPPEPEPPASDPKPPPLPQRPPQQQARAKAPPKPPEPAPEPPPLPQIAPKDPPGELAALRKAARRSGLDKLRSALANRTPVPAEKAEEPVFTVSHRQRLKRQIESCWQPIPGLDPSENYTVKLEVTLGPDGRVLSTEPVDARNSRSYRAGREWAERALRHPLCERLDVPTGWTSLTLNFDPHRMQ